MLTLEKIYQTLHAYYGNLDWWPAETAFEVVVGAILTQNTAWANVEKALANFEEDLSPERILSLDSEELEEIIRPAGYFRQKARYLKSVTEWFMPYEGDLDRIKNRPLSEVRSELLQVYGVGNETADSILLYAFDLPTFVVDAYTMRLFRRIPIDAGQTYRAIQDHCHKVLPRDVDLYKNFHALIVQVGKDYCKKKMACSGCPLGGICQKIEG